MDKKQWLDIGSAVAIFGLLCIVPDVLHGLVKRFLRWRKQRHDSQ
jgi:hypothetical protein